MTVEVAQVPAGRRALRLPVRTLRRIPGGALTPEPAAAAGALVDPARGVSAPAKRARGPFRRQPAYPVPGRRYPTATRCAHAAIPGERRVPKGGGVVSVWFQ